MNAKERCAALYRALVVATRTNRDTFYKLADGSPEWMTDVIREAHGDFLPEDTRYRMIREVLSCLSDRDVDEWEDHDVMHEMVDGLVDVYTSGLTAWLASHIDRVAYMTDAVAEFGNPDDPVKAIAYGQFREYEEIAHALVAALTSLDETEDGNA